LSAELRVLDALDLTKLIELLRQPPDDVVLIRGLENWSDSQLEGLDVARGALTRPGIAILWLPLRGLARLFLRAPNIRSWIGGALFGIDADRGLVSDEERHEQLESLRRHYRLSDDEVVAQAESGSLPPDPEFVEWLILMGRPDLVR
jgi:hypothetical protein